MRGTSARCPAPQGAAPRLLSLPGTGEAGVVASYLERYRRGECEQVWAELLALGGRVREPGLHDEAVAVARETMTRARTNIERLVPRLTSLGYAFAHPDRVFVPADEETRRLVADI